MHFGASYIVKKKFEDAAIFNPRFAILAFRAASEKLLMHAYTFKNFMNLVPQYMYRTLNIDCAIAGVCECDESADDGQWTMDQESATEAVPDARADFQLISSMDYMVYDELRGTSSRIVSVLF